MTVWKQQRPDWCPHQDCAYRASSQGCICVGELPAPTPHEGDFNTHRLCIAQSCPGDDEWLFKLEIHSGDANGMARILGRVFGFKPVAIAPIEAFGRDGNRLDGEATKAGNSSKGQSHA